MVSTIISSWEISNLNLQLQFIFWVFIPGCQISARYLPTWKTYKKLKSYFSDHKLISLKLPLMVSIFSPSLGSNLGHLWLLVSFPCLASKTIWVGYPYSCLWLSPRHSNTKPTLDDSQTLLVHRLPDHKPLLPKLSLSKILLVQPVIVPFTVCPTSVLTKPQSTPY